MQSFQLLVISSPGKNNKMITF